MDVQQKIDLLGEAAQHDVCRGCGTHSSRVRDELGRWIYPAIRPDGTRIQLLKVLQSNYCEKNCAYCANRAGRDIRRTTFTPDELARTFDEMVRRRLVQGLFLSSGVCGDVDHATDRMLATVDLVRNHYGFRGYIHLKILPAPTTPLSPLGAPGRPRVGEPGGAQRRPHRRPEHHQGFRARLAGHAGAGQRRSPGRDARVSMTTQFVVGVAGNRTANC
jgi:hypothetical protein